MGERGATGVQGFPGEQGVAGNPGIQGNRLVIRHHHITNLTSCRISVLLIIITTLNEVYIDGKYLEIKRWPNLLIMFGI